MPVRSFPAITPQTVNRFFSARISLWLLAILVALTPALVSVILVTSTSKLSDFIPALNDEVSYWHQVLTFKEVGFQGGYYTINELPPAASFTHFYTFGPWYPMVYGLIARIIGWDFTSVLVVNALLVALAILFFCQVAHLDGRQLIIMGLMLGTFWGLLLFLFTSMQEAFQQSLAIILAAVFYGSFTRGAQASRRFRLGAFMVILAAAITRLSWALLFFPFILLIGRKTVLNRIFALGLSILATLIVVEISRFTGAPGNNSIFKAFSNFGVSFSFGWSQLWDYFGANIRYFLDVTKDGLDIVQTIQVIGLALGALIVSVDLFRQRKSAWSEALFYLYNLGAIVIASCFLYIIGTFGDYRVIAAHLMITMLLLIAFRRNRVVLFIVLMNLAFIPIFLRDYKAMTERKFTPDHSQYEEFRDIAHQYIQYDSTTSNAWCNTILFNVRDYKTDLLGIPAGIGHSFFNNYGDPVLTFKSKYILLDDNNYAGIMGRKDPPQLEFLAKILNRTLYLNKTAGCR